MNNTDIEAMDGFEGPEKRLEVTFADSTKQPLRGMRSFTKDQWQDLLDTVRCTIVSTCTNSFIDSYVLSESSLFVYSHRIILKTCGTTTLLCCLDKLAEMAESIGSRINFVIFSRKNFNFPSKQQFPHGNFETEVKTLNGKFCGDAHILGPVLSENSDHHFIYFSERDEDYVDPDMPLLDSSIDQSLHDSIRRVHQSPCTLEILMSKLSPVAMAAFFKDESFVSSKDTTIKTGLASVLPDMTTDEIMFDPCGYSVNGISSKNGSYFTVHVTPESHCSFVSFETNFPLEPLQRKNLIEDVIDIFRPDRFSVVITSTESVSHPKTPLDRFNCRFKTQYEYAEGFHVMMLNYTSASLTRKASRAQLLL